MKFFKFSTWLMAVAFAFASLQKVQAETVAKIEDVDYSSLQSAVAACWEGQTVVLMSDVDLGSDENAKIYLNHGQCRLDLNGRTISASFAAGPMVISVNEGTSLTICDRKGGGAVINTSTFNSIWNSVLNADNGGLIRVEGGSFVYSGPASGGGLFYDEGGVFEVAGGTFNADPTAYLVSGCTARKTGDDTWSVPAALATVSPAAAVKVAGALSYEKVTIRTMAALQALCATDQVFIDAWENGFPQDSAPHYLPVSDTTMYYVEYFPGYGEDMSAKGMIDDYYSSMGDTGINLLNNSGFYKGVPGGEENKCYPTLAEAVAAVDVGQTIVLFGDNDERVSGGTVPFMLQLNGYTYDKTRFAPAAGWMLKTESDELMSYRELGFAVARVVSAGGSVTNDYETLAEAVATLKAGWTVTLLADCDETVDGRVMPFVLEKGGWAFSGEILPAEGFKAVESPIAGDDSIRYMRQDEDPVLTVGMKKVVSGFYQDAEKYLNATNFYITSRDGLAFFRGLVNGEDPAISAYIAAKCYGNDKKGFYTNNIFSRKTVVLLSDADLDDELWTPIGAYDAIKHGANYEKAYFYGNFDGGQHAVRNLKVSGTNTVTKGFYAGFFGYVQVNPSATNLISNLMLVNVDISGFDYVGGIAGAANQTAGRTVISNCHVVGSISIRSRSSFIGGIVGHGYGSVYDCSVVSSDGRGVIHAGGQGIRVGGIVGHNESPSCRIENCLVAGIDISMDYKYLIGGIAGTVFRGAVIRNCEVGDVRINCDASPYFGLIAGRTDGQSGVAVIEDCRVVNSTAFGRAGGAPVQCFTQNGEHANNETYSIVGSNIVWQADGLVAGGVFENIAEDYIAEGYEKVSLGTVNPETWEVREVVSASVAEVISADGTVTNGFETLDAAIGAVTDGGTVRLLQDLSLDAGLLITADKGAVTVDLNGKTLTGADETYAIRVTNAGRLTVLNGVIQLGIGWDNWAWGVDNRGGVVDVIGVEFKGAGEDYFGDYVTANWDWDYVEQEYNSDWDDYVVVALKEGARFGVTTLRDCTIGYYGPEYECYSYQEFGDQCTRLVIEGGTYECMLGSNMYTPAELCGLEIRGGTFKSNDGFWYEPVCYADITGGEVRFVGDGVFDGCLVTGGTVCLEGGTINLDGISDGTFVGPGTVQMDGPNTVSGGTFSREIYEAKSVNAGRYGDFEDMPVLGCWFVENPDGSCTVQRVGTVKVSIRSSNTGCGTIGVSKYKIGKTTWKKSTYGSPAISVDNVEATKGGTITFTATAAPKEDYHFKGWFDNAAGDGQAISVEAELTDFKYTVQDDVTIYAVFELESIYAERVAAAQAWYDGGIAAGALTIGSVDEWRAFTDAVNLNVVSLAGKTVTLTADLDFTGLEYEPVGTEAFGFGGTFDGGEHTIRGARIEAARKSGYVGIFGFATGTIKNLNAADCSIYGGYCAGVIVGEGYRVSNCHVTGSTVGEEAYFGGGVIGHSYNLTLEDVSFEDGTVTNGWKVGAIVGYGDYVDIRNAVVRGNDISESAAGLIYHANADYASFWNIKVDQRQVPLIGTTYGVAESIAFNADETADTEVWATEIVRMPSDVVTSFALNSGIFNLVSEQAVADAKALVPDPRLLEEETVVIRQIPVVAAVAEVISADGTVTNGFETIAAAIEAAQDGETVRLLADAELEEPILIGKSIVLDGNGCVLTGSALNTSGTDRATITIEGEVEVVVKELTVDKNSTVFDVAGTAVNLTLSGVTGYAFRQGVNLVDGYAGTLTLDDTRLLALADGATYITPNCGKQLESLYSKLTDLDAVSPNEGKMEYDHYTFVYGGGVGIRGTVFGAKIALENGSEVKGWWEAVLVEGSGAKVTVAGSEVVGYNGIEISAADSSLTMSDSLVRGVGDELASGFGCALAAFAPGVTFALSSSTVATYRSAWGRTHANYPSAIYTELNAFADKGLVLRDVRFVHEDGYAHTQVLRYYNGTTETRYADKVRITSEISTFTTEPDAGLPLCVAPSYALAYDLNTDKCPDGAKMPEDAPQSYTPEGCVLPKPDYVSTEVTFGGWLIDGTDTAIMAIPSGTTGGLTLKAKWDALARETFEVKVAESVEKRDDPQLTDILLTQAWVDNPSNVDPKKYSAAQSEEEKVAIVQEALNTEAANGNLKWQNYVLGLPDNDPKAQVEAGAEQSPSGEVVQVESKLVVPPVDTGYKVVYALDKVEKDAATGEEIGSRSETREVLIPVDQILKDDAKVGYAKLKAVLVPESGEGQVSVVPAANTIGIMKVESDLKKTIIPVPWGELGGGEIRVSNLIQVSNLTPGDRLYVYDIEAGKSYVDSKFESWELTAAFKWAKIGTATLDENGQQTNDAGKESDDVSVRRGQGVWLERQDVTKPIILSGQYNKTDGEETTEVELGTESSPVHNILATPLAEEIDLDVAVGNAGKDTIFVPTKGAPRVYSVDEKGKWGYSEDVVLGNGKKIPVRKVGGTLPASSGFWYVSRGGKDGKGSKITWAAAEKSAE